MNRAFGALGILKKSGWAPGADRTHGRVEDRGMDRAFDVLCDTKPESCENVAAMAGSIKKAAAGRCHKPAGSVITTESKESRSGVPRGGGATVFRYGDGAWLALQTDVGPEVELWFSL